MKSLIIIPIVLLCAFSQASAQKDNAIIRKGNKLYEEGKYKDAEIDYRKAMEVAPKSVKGEYNLGNSLYKQENWEEAGRSFTNSAGKMKADDNTGKAAAYHNLGNSLFKAEKYQESIEAYKQALRLNPSDDDTRYNLSYALKKLVQQQQQQQQQNKDDKQDDKQDKKDQQQQQQPQDQKDQQQDKQQQQQQKQQISKQDAERMLQALKNDEQKTIDKVKKQKVKPVQVQIEKDW
ncbi:MAG: tetratricopeptide repeat protein [Lentimicrobiaceae bacterium]|nr:tetratricopeptide repeat protein [Lentimicrobiaceae bacterium]